MPPLVALLLAFISFVVGGCSPSSDSDRETIESPRADRESWDVRVELRQPGLHVYIEAPYMADFIDAQQTRADSGASIVITQGATAKGCSISAERLTLYHADRTFACGGQVRLAARDSLTLEADTLVWYGESELLRVPGSLRIDLRSGWERGYNLTTDADVTSWTMERVTGMWYGSRGDQDYQVRVQAAQVRGERQNGYQVEYDSVEVVQDGIRASGPLALYLERDATLIFPLGVQGSDRDTRFAAEHARIDLAGNRMQAEGEVHFSVPDSAASAGFQLRADRLEHDRTDDHLAVAGGPVHFEQELRRIQADSLHYRRPEEHLTALGSVIYQDSLARLEADTLAYDQVAMEIEARGSIRLRSPRLEGQFACRHLVYRTDTRIARLIGDPSFERSGNEDGAKTFRSSAMVIDLDRRLLQGIGNVVLRTPDAEARALRGWFDDEADMLELGGGSTFVQARDNGDWLRHIQADSMRVELEEGEVVAVWLPGALNGKIRSGDGSTDWLSGGDGHMEMRAGQLERFHIGNTAEVVHHAARSDEVTSISGARMVLDFDAEGLRRARVDGDAVVVSRITEDDGRDEVLTRAAGEELEVHFGASGLEVHIGPRVDGWFIREKRD